MADHSSQTARIEHNLSWHAPAGAEVSASLDALRMCAKDFSHAVDRLVPDSREKSLALSEIEDACQHAVAGVVRNQ